MSFMQTFFNSNPNFEVIDEVAYWSFPKVVVKIELKQNVYDEYSSFLIRFVNKETQKLTCQTVYFNDTLEIDTSIPGYNELTGCVLTRTKKWTNEPTGKSLANLHKKINRIIELCV